MKFHIRNEDGELEVGSYAELRTLYQRQFISDDDEVRREGSDQWQKAGAMTDLHAIKPRPYFHGLEFAWLVVAITVLTLLILLFRWR